MSSVRLFRNVGFLGRLCHCPVKVVENRQVPIIFGEDFVVHIVVIRLVGQAVGKPGKLVPAVVRLRPDDGGGDPAVDEEQVHAPEEDKAQERP